MQDLQEIKEARRWVQLNCHHGHTRYVLERGVAYVEAIVKAGLCPETIDGEDLYQCLASRESEEARRRFFVQPEF